MKKLMITTMALVLGLFLMDSADAQERRRGKAQFRDGKGARSQEQVREFARKHPEAARKFRERNRGNRNREDMRKRLERFRQEHPEAAEKIRQRIGERRERINQWAEKNPEAAAKLKKKMKQRRSGRQGARQGMRKERPKNRNTKEKGRSASRTRQQTLERIEKLEQRIQALRRQLDRDPR